MSHICPFYADVQIYIIYYISRFTQLLTSCMSNFQATSVQVPVRSPSACEKMVLSFSSISPTDKPAQGPRDPRVIKSLRHTLFVILFSPCDPGLMDFLLCQGLSGGCDMDWLRIQYSLDGQTMACLRPIHCFHDFKMWAFHQVSLSTAANGISMDINGFDVL